MDNPNSEKYNKPHWKKKNNWVNSIGKQWWVWKNHCPLSFYLFIFLAVSRSNFWEKDLKAELIA